MASARTLQPQDQIAHYVIVGPLGAGGMGEVYIAQDSDLERNVALKILPPELVQKEERVRRFVREAKSASSLNHPNIVTVHEIGQAPVKRASRGGADSPSSTLHYIAMELVRGETLEDKIHTDRIPLGTLIGYLSQAAKGLAKAHAAGIVHRDLKPSNIMISSDGYTKILDFGLAKLVERDSSNEGTTLSTETARDTRPDAVVGTVGYMSPEQVRGGAIDYRSDIFSFGCILYEAATRTRAFEADSSVEVMHKILHEKPTPIEERNKEVPAELRRLIRRCLAKSPDQRLQSSKDLANELGEIVDEWETLSATGSSGSKPSVPVTDEKGSKRIPKVAMLAGTVIIALVIAVGGSLLRRGCDSGSRGAAGNLSIRTLTSTGLLNGLALSPDGRFLAYSLLSFEGERSLRVRQLTTGSDVVLLPPPMVRPPTKLTFSPDGDYLYYIMNDPERDNYSALFDIPTLGGRPRKRAYDVDSRVSFSPDGSKICFRRGVSERKEERLIVLDLQNARERVLASVSAPVQFGDPVWSPDGRTIAVFEAGSGGASGTPVVAYRVKDGHRQAIGAMRWSRVQTNCGLAWHPDGRSLILAASDQALMPDLPLWKLTYPGGRATRITNDASSYAMLSVASDGSTIAAGRTRRESNLWAVTPGNPGSVHQVTFQPADEGGVSVLDATGESTAVYVAKRNGAFELFSIGESGVNERVLTERGRVVNSTPWYRPGRGVVHERADERHVPHIWVTDATGDNARRLTSGDGERIVDVSPDGGSVLFRRDGAVDTLWSISTDGGEAVKLGPSVDVNARFSPDGRFILHTVGDAQPGRGDLTRHVIPANGGAPTASPEFPPGAFGMTWAPDGQSVYFLNNSNLLRNLFRQSLPDGTPVEVTQFGSGRLVAPPRFSNNGKRILLRRQIGYTVNLWAVNPDGSHAVPITQFESGMVFDSKWSQAGSRIFFTYGNVSDNAVLIRTQR